MKWDTPHLSIAPTLYIHWEWPVTLQTLMYFTESTLLFISCNCSQSCLPGETWCWNREAVLKKYKLLNHEWLCGSKMPFWITPGNEVESDEVSGAWVQPREGGAVPGQAVPPSPAEYLAGLLWAHRLWLGAAASSAQCSVPNTFQMMNMMQTYWKKKYISGEKNNYFSKQDNEAELMLRGHKIEQNFRATALTSNNYPPGDPFAEWVWMYQTQNIFRVT